ncbi:isochorismate synthase [Flavobacterium pallidum]|uniref:isochorismate synthase n=2 Tax=Flavobacterium pallidum TaxID=2172098 RepID=A0A2S1SJU7_9FLAO|nr:isochorismate synthase [Flavobacterium pallidum]
MAQKHFDKEFPFVLYKKPHAKVIRGLFQESDETHSIQDFTETGYAFVSFSGNEMLLIPERDSDFQFAVFENQVRDKEVISSSKKAETNREFHLKLVNDAIRAISQQKFDKVVLSRKEMVELPHFDFGQIFISLSKNYPEAYVYCWFHPKTGFWFGAFAEQLLKTGNGKLHTMSVAGTQKWHEGLIWMEKEKQEQRFVTDFITDELKPFSTAVNASTPYTLKAGTLAHVKTDITAELKPGAHLKNIVEALHPTPAVCGLPKQPALDFILENEGYDRGFYSGFHGELNKDFLNGNEQTDFFVNLRCMHVEASGNTANLYIGGGITKDSNPEAEWLETVNKSQTMKKVLL